MSSSRSPRRFLELDEIKRVGQVCCLRTQERWSTSSRATAKLTKYRDSTQAQFADDILKIADGSRQTGRPWGYHTTCSKLHARAVSERSESLRDSRIA